MLSGTYMNRRYEQLVAGRADRCIYAAKQKKLISKNKKKKLCGVYTISCLSSCTMLLRVPLVFVPINLHYIIWTHSHTNMYHHQKRPNKIQQKKKQNKRTNFYLINTQRCARCVLLRLLCHCAS